MAACRGGSTPGCGVTLEEQHAQDTATSSKAVQRGVLRRRCRARRTAAQLAQEYRSKRGETEPHVEDAATSMKASRRGVRMEAVARGAPRRSWTDRSRRGRLDPETERSSRLRRAEARLSGEDVTGAVSRSAVSASARRRRSGVEPLLSLLPFILSLYMLRTTCACSFSRCSRSSLSNG